MTLAWYIWYGLQIGLSREEALTIPFAELLDLVAVHQIKTEGARQKVTRAQEEEAFWELLTWR